jgi:hypothetical protein
MFCYKSFPVPPREWSRVQGPCSLFVVNEIDNQDYVTIPLTGKVVPTSQIGAELAMLNKGNILQYKKNSSNLTKKQKYSQLAQGHRVSRHTTWATQSANGYTNPNIRCLERVNSETIEIDPNSDNPTTIQDLGTLVCGTLENPITGVVVRQPPIPNCHLTTDSNVPGQIMSLCWNDGITPWYPRTRYTMTNSGNKWPTNATLISAVIIEPPVLTIVSLPPEGSTVSLSWTNNQVASLPISSYNIYQNFKLVANVLHPNNTITINNLTPGLIYVFYVTAVSNTYPIKTESRPSNIVSNTTIYFVVTGNPIQKIEGNQYTVAFTQTGTITFINPTNPQVTLFCGGGGGGGGGGAYVDGGGGGGGGGGGITTTTFNSSSSTTYIAVVGSGGAKGNAGRTLTNGSNGSPGSNSTFTGGGISYTGLGGYGGEGSINNSTNGANGGASGTPGSVSGKSAKSNILPATPGTIGGGGGGGSYNISNTSDFSSGANGGINISVNNNSNFGAGGGGGLGFYNGKPGSGGNSNAGNGGNPGSDGKPNTGGGGGGGQAGNGVTGTYGSSYAGGFGGSGIVVLYFLLL